MTSEHIGRVTYPSRASEAYIDDLLSSVDADAIRRRAPRLVLNYGHSPASLIVPSLIGALGVELIGLNGFVETSDIRVPTGREEAAAETSRVVTAVGADIGVVMDVSAERIWLVDDRGTPMDAESTLLLLLQEIAGQTDEGDLLVPIVETSLVESVVDGASHRITRTKASLGDLLAKAAGRPAVFAGASSGGYVFPDFLPAYDAMASLCKLLELLAPVKPPLSSLVAELPVSTLVHRQLPCPWSQKGTVMRVLTERLKGRDLDLLDGIKINDRRGWAQVLPDPDEPLVHIYAEGATEEASVELEAELRAMVDEIMETEGAATAAGASS